jgi:hypothetical protein
MAITVFSEEQVFISVPTLFISILHLNIYVRSTSCTV